MVKTTPPSQNIASRFAALITALLLIATAATGQNSIVTTEDSDGYRTLCENNGVPVPPTVLDLTDFRWRLYGDLENPFINTGLDAELWSFDAGADGFCLSLPRKSGSTVEVLGMICMADTGETCFFTNPEGETFSSPPPDPNDQIQIDELIGGFDLVDNPEGVCADCHTGANPFIVHPEDPMFQAAMQEIGSLFPSSWPTPIIPDHSDWPANALPIESLGPTEGPGCDTCHASSGQGGDQVGGRLPLLSTQYPRYCEEVLAASIGEHPADPAPATMPPSYSDADANHDHRDWLLAACQSRPGGGTVVTFDPPPQIAVPPPAIAPPYACTSTVMVTNALLDAELTLEVDGMFVAQEPMREPGGHVFVLPKALEKGQTVAVTQTAFGVTSPPVITWVRSHKEDYPNGLPAPTITPAPIYECASAIAVANVPGATVEVQKTEVDDGTQTVVAKESGYNLTWMRLGKAGTFEVGDSFTATQTICQDTSDRSDKEVATTAPSSLPQVTFEPPLPDQQFLTLENIVQGSHVMLEELAGTVVFERKSLPYRRYRHVDLQASPLGPVDPAHQLVASQKLCRVQSPEPDPPPVRQCSADAMIAEIAKPQHGDDFVIVTKSVPGATIRVFGAGFEELGNGIGSVINLSRDLVGGEIVAVHQSLPPTCEPAVAFTIMVETP